MPTATLFLLCLENEPNALMRALELFAVSGMCPLKLKTRRSVRGLIVAMSYEIADQARAKTLLRKLRQMPAVTRAMQLAST